jgi:hypothetical protein
MMKKLMFIAYYLITRPVDRGIRHTSVTKLWNMTIKLVLWQKATYVVSNYFIIIEFSKKLFIIEIENIWVFDLKKSSQVAILWEG